MYLQSWQIFLLGCVIGGFISFLVLSIAVVRFLERIGMNPKSKDEKTIDLIARLNYVLLAKKIINDTDIQFLLEKISYDDWKQANEPKEEEVNGNT